MLPRQQFGGGHDGSLAIGVGRHGGCSESYYRLARAYFALQEAVHRSAGV
jgi:hypothetical protein